jgi:O-antigen ligase
MATPTSIRAGAFDRQKMQPLADWLAVAVAVSLPWSTSATGITVALWLVAGVSTTSAAALRRALLSASGGIPVLLWILAAVGMLWADVSWSERFDGLGGFNKLLVIPLLLSQFRGSANGNRVLYGFLASVTALLAVSWILVALPQLPWQGKGSGIPVKDYILQSTEFTICAFVLLGVAIQQGRAGHWRIVAGLIVLAGLFFANIFFVISGRTVLLVVPALALLLGWRQFGWRGVAGAGALGCIAAVLIWLASPYMRQRIEVSIHDWQAYEASDAFNSTGLHAEFLKKSLSFVETAPVIGHGTGSIREQFRGAVGEAGSSAIATVNPHNQIFAVAIQLGLIGAAVLLAMWLAHFRMFRGGGLTAWVGTVVVVQNFVGSLVNSHLFDFTQGWLYVFGVGVSGGMMLRAGDKPALSAVAKP